MSLYFRTFILDKIRNYRKFQYFEHLKEKFQNCADQIKQLNSTLSIVTEPIQIDFAKAFYFKDQFISLLIKTTHLPTGFEVSKNLFFRIVLRFFWLCTEF